MSADKKLLSLDAALTLATQHCQNRRLDKAGKLLAKILSKHPKHGEALHLAGVVAQQRGDMEPALHFFQRACINAPTNALYHANFCELLRRNGQSIAAIEAGTKAVALGPGMPQAHANLAIAYIENQQFKEGVEAHTKALTLDESHIPSLHGLASLALQTGNHVSPEDGLRYAQAAYSITPSGLESIRNLAGLLSRKNQATEAESVLIAGLAALPRQTDLWVQLATTRARLNNTQGAQEAYRCALDVNPQCVPAILGLARLEYEHNHLSLAHTLAEQACALQPENPAALTLLAGILNEQSRTAEAGDLLNKALMIAPEYIGALLGLAAHHLESGDRNAAIGSYRKVLEQDEHNVAALTGLANAIKISRQDMALVDQLCSLKPEELPERQRCSLEFTLGKCFNDVGDTDRAFSHFTKGAAIKRKTAPYDASDNAKVVDNIQALFSEAFLSDNAPGKSGAPSEPRPIFVVGMPRSGTSLVEQILASHPQVTGAGELPYMMDLASNPNGEAKTGRYPQALEHFGPNEFAALGSRYRSALRNHGDTPYIVDKLPANFFTVGAIQLALPDAIIIHVQRDARDTCLSCFTKLFNHGQYFTYDQDDLARFYNDYARLMTHWRGVLPPNRLFELRYEELVSNTEEVIREMLAHCGLTWDPACLQHHKTQRVVRTASVTQVRQPMYADSVGRWKEYAPHLKPLLDSLDTL